MTEAIKYFWAGKITSAGVRRIIHFSHTDRFLHHAEIIQITGKSYRMKERACKKDQK